MASKVLPPSGKRLPPNAGKGRKRGVPNKTTVEARRVALAFLDRRTEDEIDELWEEAKDESPGKALGMYLGAMEFVLPKRSRVEKGIPDASDEELLAEVRRRAAEAKKAAEG